MSTRTLATALSTLAMLTPPMRSDSFWLFASHRAAADVAPFCESAKTEEPLAVLFTQASAWMETRRCAFARRAICTRPPRLTKWSDERVMMARMLGSALMSCARRFPIASTTVFSLVPRRPIAPGSSPP